MRRRSVLLGTTLTVFAALAAPNCQRRSLTTPRVSREPTSTVVQKREQQPPRHLSPSNAWPIPDSATKLSEHFWSITLVPSRNTLRPQRNSKTQMVYSLTIYDKAGRLVSGPTIRIVQLQYTDPQWQPLFLQMAVGEVRRVWVIDPNHTVTVCDVELRNVVLVK